MSIEQNTRLLEEAAELIDYFEGTMIGRVLEAAIDSNDLESLDYQVMQARFMQFDLEFRPEAYA